MAVPEFTDVSVQTALDLWKSADPACDLVRLPANPAICYYPEMRSSAAVLLFFVDVSLFSDPVNAAEYRLIQQDQASAAFSAGPIRRSATLIDDATLYDVDVVGSRCWTVGERGVILRSADAGMTWIPGILPFDCSLHSVCFLTDRIGFVAGLRPDLHSKTDRGVLLTTRDGGQFWHDVTPDTRLPGLRFIQFFGLDRGVAVTTATSGQGGTLLVTQDSGQTWNQIKPPHDSTDWVHAAFTGPDEGLVVGSRQTFGLINSNKLVITGHPRPTLQTVNQASLSDDGQAWMVGDGGFIRRSTRRGVTWKPPAGRFPSEFRDIFRLRTVVHDGDRVCVAGTPACSVLHSDNAGETWSTVPCASGGSVHRFARTGSDSILAVGSWGMIMRSDDFGRSWRRIRHGDRRSTLMYIVTDLQDASPLMLASVAGEQGYRVTVVQPSGQLSHPSMSEHWQAELSGVGANTLATDWRFARTRIQHGMSQSALLESWDASSDGRLRELVPLRLAAQIRNWRPDVICIESSSQNDSVAAVWRSAIQTAERIAAGSGPRSVPLYKAGLQPWSVQRIFHRTHTRSTPLQFRADMLLPRLRTTAGLIATNWNLAISPESGSRVADAAYVVHTGSGTDTPEHMFQGIAVPPGTDGRRQLVHLETGIEDLQETVGKHCTLKMAVTGKVYRDPLGEDLIAHTRTIGRSLPTAMATEQLQHLLQLFRRRENLEGRIAVQQEFVRRLPNSPQAAQAAKELHLLYSSAEILLLRKREQADKSGRLPGTAVRNPNGFQLEATLDPTPGVALPAVSIKPRLLPAAGTSLHLLRPSRGTQDKALERHWDQQADLSWEVLGQLAPHSATTARQQLILAARYRRMRHPGRERTTLASASGAADPYSILARNEMQAGAVESILPAFNLPKSRHRPKLDGLLADTCWQQAPEIRLSDTQPGDGVADSLVMLSWDAEFLYFAGRLPVAADVLPASEVFDRSHDEANITSDYIELQVDVDRDYSTAWHFVIDSAGRTSDRCWQFTRWNPEWFVATQRDEAGWRFEAAIPIQELRPQKLGAGTKWAMSIRRVVPGYADQRLEVGESAQKLPTWYSLIRFIRNRDPK